MHLLTLPVRAVQAAWPGTAGAASEDGRLCITLHYITYSTQQGVGTPLGANERLIGGLCTGN
jgi:hypothetical protein